MRILGLSIFVTTFGFLPVYVLNTMVMPELLALKETYSNLDTLGEDLEQNKTISGADYISDSSKYKP